MEDFEIANLKDTPESQVTETEIYNAIESYLNTNSRVRVSSRLVSTDLELGDSQLVVEATNAVDMGPDLQKAMDTLNERGGGTIYLKAGTYTIKTALTGYSSVSIEGISPSASVLDFVSTAANLSFTGSSVYSTGTISSISSGVTVTGSGTSWLANASAGQYLFIGTRHYKIAAVTGNTTLILAEGYTDNITFPGAAYRIATPIVDVRLKNFSMKSSTGTALVFTDAVQINLDNVVAVLCNKGYSFTNVSRLSMDRVLAASNTSNGYEFTNVGLCDWESINASANGAHGFVLDNCKTISGLLSSVSNTTDGFNLTSCDDMIITVEASSNGGQGMEMVSGCDNNHITGIVNSNTSDGIKLTATSDNNTLGTGLRLNGNGGYGINIAASTCDENTIAVPSFGTNTSGDYNDSGTSTNIVATVVTNFNSFCPALAVSGAGASMTTDATSHVSVAKLTNGVDNQLAYFNIHVPAGRTGISAIKVIYKSSSTGNTVNLMARVSRIDVTNGGAEVLDDNGSDVNSSPPGSAGQWKIQALDSSCFNGIGTIATDDIIGVEVKRDGNGDSHSGDISIPGIIITFT